MPLEEPAWWYGAQGDWRAHLLAPIARIWGWQGGRRLRRPPRHRAAVPVVCIGNFTAGGTGKTPLSLLVAAMLAERGIAPAFLTRGYGRTRGGAHWVEASIDTARDVGDEPMLLARAAPVLICADRAAGARLIEARATVQAIVMDDGLQNPSLAKDLTIAVVDARRGVGNGAVIPAGPLRAPLEQQLAICDAIVVNQPAASPDASPVAWLRERFPGPVLHARTEPAGETGWLRAQPVVAFAGIANPKRFFDLVTALGGDLAERMSFPDHHAFTQADAASLLALAARREAMLVTTEKDWVRLIGAGGDLGTLRERSRPLPIRLTMGERDKGRLAALLDGALARRLSVAPRGP